VSWLYELTYGVGFSWRLASSVEWVSEIYGAVELSTFGAKDGGHEGNGSGSLLSDLNYSAKYYKRVFPAELMTGFKFYLATSSFFAIGASIGLTGVGPLDNVGSPDVRVIASFVFEPTVGDRDGDGIKDDVDKCPDEPEDFDDFEDQDGCPDPDNDGDGIPDVDDKCPNTPENFNGFEDEDGCPDFQGVSFEGEAISVTPAIEFKRGKDDINASYFDVLRNLAKLIEAHPEWKKIEIQVATDEKGKPDKLLELTTKRAMAIQQFLVTEGVNFRILKVRAKGKADPAGVRFVIKP
jgi:outer membrane protein OmpA-like peptidoglycan-associated protein